ncbi:hypothetical protein [Aporhodopirellula aestuarii]|uniref:Uncharacterized protein n=1 Tax=Aporhodopirellula aestuarii TaxID=2950107 RepID=A0ABT0UBS9_9BACT|nr:hypothetical protein [Aporhodopirellula aestuarii]MCM2374472.1 hypothetical protein [Aporhodopirellula aestuarii]
MTYLTISLFFAASVCAVLIVAAVLIAIAILTRGNQSRYSLNYGGDAVSTIYRDLQLLECEPRGERLYVRYVNNGARMVSTVTFRIKVSDAANRLIADLEESIYDTTQPGETNENLIESERLAEVLTQVGIHVTAKIVHGYTD